jgi:NADH dehydrogenase
MASATPHVLVIGCGFGGLTAAKALAKPPVQLTLIDKRNHHLFQPLLYQVATAGLSPADIAMPIRAVFRGRRNVRVLLGEVTAIDTAAREVRMDEHRIGYDLLVVATGARHAYFGHDDWELFAPGLKQVEDALDIRRRILLAFERAEAAEDPEERRRLLTFAIVGAGPTGVELAGAIAELAKVALAMDFRSIDPREARVLLIEAGERVLPAFPPSLSDRARAALGALGVEVMTRAAVTNCTAGGVRVSDRLIPTATVLWAAGVMASAAAIWLNVPHDRAGRVLVQPDLTLRDHPEIFVIGDTSALTGADGKPLPGLAPVAKQQGAYVAAAVRARLGSRPVGPFVYRNLGSLATIGRGRAVADFGWLRLHGAIAWILWGVVHVAFLIGFRNRIIVLLDWLWSYVTFKRGARLITGATGYATRGSPSS